MDSPSNNLDRLEYFLETISEEGFKTILNAHQIEFKPKLDIIFKEAGEVSIEKLRNHFGNRFKDFLKAIFSTCQWTQQKKKPQKKLRGSSKRDNKIQEQDIGRVKCFFCKQCNTYHHYKSKK